MGSALFPTEKENSVRGKGVNALKEWTGRARASTIHDSAVDEFTTDGLFEKVQGKRNIALVGFTTEGDVFGGFYSVAVTEQDIVFYDPNMFVFSFESHGRCETPQRFGVKEERKEKAYVRFFKNDNQGFVVFWFGSCGFVLGDERSNSWCYSLSVAFEGLKNTTLTGQNNAGGWREGPNHHCTRLVAVQLE